jgi:RNA polymerase sigma-70 factor (ECF subfamily)
MVRLGIARDLDDATQEVFVRVWRALPELREGRYVATWLYRVALNAALDILRSRKRGVARLLDDTAPAEAQPARLESAEAMLARRQALDSALDELSHDHRAVLVLHDVEGFTMSEIAAMTEVPEGTVKSRLFHARKQLRAALSQRGIAP